MVQKEDTLHGKAGFDHLYNQPDPRGYYQTLGALSYHIPQNAHAVFAPLLQARFDGPSRAGDGTVLDICCSYGVNAALLRCDLTLHDLFDRYGDDSLADLSPEELAEADRSFYASRLHPQAPRVIGIDVADRAVDYGRSVGLLEAGWAANLETDDPSPALADAVAEVGLVTITGGVGYITERTFDRLLGVFPAGQAPWVAAFVLRMYPYDGIASALERHGLVTEQLTGTTFPQRRFASEEEQQAAVEGVRARDLDPAGREDAGWYHCDFFLSRPESEAHARPLRQLVAADHDPGGRSAEDL
jgi:hypothetical protein